MSEEKRPIRISGTKIEKLGRKDQLDIKKLLTDSKKPKIEVDKEEKDLEDSTVIRIKSLEKDVWDTANVFVATLKSKEGTKEAIFKTCETEHGMDCACHRERAAYVVDKILGFNLVPTTVIKEIETSEGETIVGSLQDFNYAEVADNAHIDPSDEKMIRMRLFDYIIWNYDRHDWNYLVTTDGELRAIDNADAFGSRDDEWAKQEIVSDLEDISGERVPDDVVKIFEKIKYDPGVIRELERNLKPLLSKDLIKSLVLRIKKLEELVISRGEIPNTEELERLTYN